MLSGASSLDELINKAIKNNQSAMALTDTNGLYGAVEFYTKAKQAGIKPIIGSQIDDSSGNSAIVISKNAEGYRALCRLITARRLDDDTENSPENRKRFSLCETLPSEVSSGNLIIISGSESILDILKNINSGENLFAGVFHPLNKSERQKIRMIYAFSENRQIKRVAVNRVYFASRKDFLTHKLLTAIRLLSTVDTVSDEHLMSKHSYLKSSDEMAKYFSFDPNAIENTLKIAEQCNLELPLGNKNFPLYPKTGVSQSPQILSEICRCALRERYNNSQISAAQKRLDYELDVIIQMGYADYFLIVKDIVDFARGEKIPCVGRGSAADSIVSYLLHITDVDPIKHNLYFERFLNRERIDPPDIDVDFCWKRRDDVLKYVYDTYGADKVAMISTHVAFELRSSIREAGKALGMPESEVNKITERLPHFSSDGIDEVFEKYPETKSMKSDSPLFKRIIKLAKKIGGFPRHLGIHAGGIVIAPTNITNWTPLERASKGLVITQYEMRSIEELGLLKIDLLGQRSLSVIADCAAEIRHSHGISIDPEKIPMDDYETRKIMREGKTIGCFQIESPGMRGLLRKLKADEFEILTAASSLIRPGPKDSGMMKKFIRRHHKTEPVTYTHPLMKDVLQDTYGVMVYQEDVLKVAQTIAGMSLGRADLLRRSMSAKKGAIPLSEFKREFFEGAEKKGIPPKITEEIWNQMHAFAGYAFCKAHSASYARISFQATYLKAHYPSIFFAAVISNGGGFYDIEAYVSEARRWGLTLLLPSINHSVKDWRGIGENILCGLGQIKNLTDISIQKIISSRENKPFISPEDFFLRANLPPSDLYQLIYAGALDEFGLPRTELFYLCEEYIRAKVKPYASEDLFEAPIKYADKKLFKDLSESELFTQEYNALDVAIRFHPLRLYTEKLRREKIIMAKDIAKFKNRLITLAGWIVTHRRVRTSKNEIMKFVTLEDETDIYDAVLFPDTYKKFGDSILTRGPYIITGKVTHEHGVCAIEPVNFRLIH